jgi:ABC-type multidrug transport system ATPase subunit
MDDKIKFKIRHLSATEKRKVSIISTIIGKPTLMFMDEPFVGLD